MLELKTEQAKLSDGMSLRTGPVPLPGGQWLAADAFGAALEYTFPAGALSGSTCRS